jgi:hypothetical protein
MTNRVVRKLKVVRKVLLIGVGMLAVPGCRPIVNGIVVLQVRAQSPQMPFLSKARPGSREVRVGSTLPKVFMRLKQRLRRVRFPTGYRRRPGPIGRG